MNAWSQWLAQQQSGQQIRALRVAQKEARDAGLPEPTHKELPQWSKMK
jgi:predicted NAD/FAD-dependent oxidoreductase